jgi:hypothetical protein
VVAAISITGKLAQIYAFKIQMSELTHCVLISHCGLFQTPKQAGPQGARVQLSKGQIMADLVFIQPIFCSSWLCFIDANPRHHTI